MMIKNAEIYQPCVTTFGIHPMACKGYRCLHTLGQFVVKSGGDQHSSCLGC